MATAKWAAPGSTSADIAGTNLNSLVQAGTSPFLTYDNSTNRDLYANVRVVLGSITPVSGASIALRVHAAQEANAPDDIGSVGGGDVYNTPVTTGASAKVLIFPMVRLYPESMRLQITNNTGVAFASSGNAVYVRPYNEDVS